MPTIDFEGKTVELDDDGYLVNLDDWAEGIAGILAKDDDQRKFRNFQGLFW